jgi:hypothetical protein
MTLEYIAIAFNTTAVIFLRLSLNLHEKRLKRMESKYLSILVDLEERLRDFIESKDLK